LINAQGEVVGTFGMSRDVTKIKMLEKDRHTAELDKAVAQGKFEIASGVMHDIGNAVVGFGSYLTRVKRLQEEDDPDNLQNLAGFFEDKKTALSTAIGEDKAGALIKMLSGIAHTQKNNRSEISRVITEQLNIIANIEQILNIQRQYITGHESKERKPVDLSGIINDSLSMLFSLIDKMNIAVSLNMSDNLPLIKGDHTKLMQVILNLLKNSIEAIDMNAPEKNISLNLRKQADKLVLEVKDTGIGFDDETTRQLFSKGYTTKKSGAGLGLHNCKTIIESHEGSIDISSEGPGKGAVAMVSFKI
jgi:signal transduction histidine kinase